MQKVLTLGVSAMALAALVAASSGCTGDDDDDGASGNYGGTWNVTVDSSGGSSYADFFESYEGDTSSYRDIPNDTCLQILGAGASTSADPIVTYEDVGDSLTAVSGATTMTLVEDTTPSLATGQYVSAGVAGAPDDATYSLTIDGDEFATIDVPALPFPISVTGETVSWTTMGASDAFVAVIATNFSKAYLCHTADDGSYDFSSTAATLTSGLVAVLGANYAEVGHTDGTVIVIGQSNNPFDIDNLIFYP
jgi:hypothetical protein